MFILLIVFWNVVCSSQNHDSPIIIERPLNRIEFDDLLLEYNRDLAPVKNVTISLDITITYAKHSEDILSTLIITEQSWTDRRLLFRGNSALPLPSNVRPWLPDTYIRDAVRNELRETSSFLSFDGMLKLKERRYLQIPCEDQSQIQKTLLNNCTITFGSFANRGAEEIRSDVKLITIYEKKASTSVAHRQLRDFGMSCYFESRQDVGNIVESDVNVILELVNASDTYILMFQLVLNKTRISGSQV